MDPLSNALNVPINLPTVIFPVVLILRLKCSMKITMNSMFFQWVFEIKRLQSLKLKDCNNLRESDILINEIDTLESILGRLSDLKSGAETRAIEVANANYDFKQANRLRKKLIKFQDTEDEISAQCSNTKSRLTS